MACDTQQGSEELHSVEADLQSQAPKRCGFGVLAAVGVSCLLGASLMAMRGFHPHEGSAAGASAVVGYAEDDDTPSEVKEVKFCSSFSVSLCPADQPLLVPNADTVLGNCAADCCVKACSSFDVKQCPATKPALVSNAAAVVGSSHCTCCVPYEVRILGAVAVSISDACNPNVTSLPACCRLTGATIQEKLRACHAGAVKGLVDFGKTAFDPKLKAIFRLPDVRLSPPPGAAPEVLLTGEFAIVASSYFDFAGPLNFKDFVPQQFATEFGAPLRDVTVAVSAQMFDNVGTHFFGKLTPDSDIYINCTAGPENLDPRCAAAMQGPAVTLLFNTLGPELATPPIKMSIADGTKPLSFAAPTDLLRYDGNNILFYPTGSTTQNVLSASSLTCDNGASQCEHWFGATVDPVQGASLYYISQNTPKLLATDPSVTSFSLAALASQPFVVFSKGVGIVGAADKSRFALESLALR